MHGLVILDENDNVIRPAILFGMMEEQLRNVIILIMRLERISLQNIQRI